jgi:hypothetical protein
MSPEDVSEKVGEYHHCKNLKIENFGESQLKMAMASPGIIWASWNNLCFKYVYQNEIRIQVIKKNVKKCKKK